jgi:hypothetical protein
MSDWIDSHQTACASIEDDEIVIRIPRLAIPIIASAVTRPRSVFASDIAGLREEIVTAFNEVSSGECCIGGIIIGQLTGGTPHATALRFPDESV